MGSLAAFLSAELGVVLVGEDVWANAENLATLARLDTRRVARAIERGASSGDLDCIGAGIMALELADECDLDEDHLHFLSQIGHSMGGSATWVEPLLAAAERGSATDLERLRRFMQLPRPSGRRAVLARLAPRLIALLDGSLRAEAACALEAFARHQPKDAANLSIAVPRLIELLADDATRDAATHALRSIGDPRAIEPLIALLRNPAVTDYTKAWSVAPALEDLRAVDAAPVLIELLERNGDRIQRGFYICALAKLDPVGAAPTVARVADPADANAHVLACVEAGALAGDAGALAFLERASTEMGHLRGNALASLARVRGPGALEQLCQVARNESDWLVGDQAIAALRKLRDPRAFDALVAALGAGRPAAARALFELGDVRAIPPLVQALRKDHGYRQMDVMIKEGIIEALGDFARDIEEVRSILVFRLDDRSDYIAECAAIALQQLRPGCREGIPQLVRRLDLVGRVPHLVERRTVPMVERLERAARRGGPPRDIEAATAVLAAMRRLRDGLSASVARERMTTLIETWSRWLASC